MECIVDRILEMRVKLPTVMQGVQLGLFLSVEGYAELCEYLNFEPTHFKDMQVVVVGFYSPTCICISAMPCV